MMFRKCLILCALTLPLFAQDSLFNSAPPEIEKALRERVTGFYQCYVDGKFRQGEQYVAEDTKEMYYNQEKNKIRGFEIVTIKWEEGFQKASVVTTIQTNIIMRGQSIPANAPMATRWKVEDGKWVYYVDVKQGKETPFGTMTPGPGNNPGLKIDEMIKNPNIILNQVKISKERVLLKSWQKSSDEVVITNGMPGMVSIVMSTESLPGLTWELDKRELNSGETARLSFKYDPKDPSPKPALKASIKLEPFNRTITLPVEFDIPDEVKKKLPKQ